jgi:Kazal-type serine protease inhibitor domain
MKTKFVVLLVALALNIFALNGAQAAGMGKVCGGFAGLQCGDGQFCQYKPGVCGRFDMTGICTRVPHFCPLFVRPVCGCNGVTYGNDCERERAMVSKSHDGKCI